MPLEQLLPFIWKWSGVQVRRSPRFETSPPLRYQDREWELRCYEDHDNNVRFSIYPTNRGLPDPRPFTIDIYSKIQEMTLSGAFYVCNWRDIRHFQLQKLGSMSQEFVSNRQLTFRVEILGPRNVDDMNPKTFAEASVQTTALTTSSILCADALSEDFVNMLHKDSNHDVKLHCNGLTTGAHKDVLCSRSPVLAKMLRADMVEGRSGEVYIRDMDLDTFQQFRKFLYTGKLDDGLTFDVIMSLYEVSDMYEVKSLKTLCADFLVTKLMADNACEVLAVADAHSDPKLVEAVTVFILEKKVHRSGDHWRAFCRSHSLLATKVLNRYCEMFEGQ